MKKLLSCLLIAGLSSTVAFPAQKAAQNMMPAFNIQNCVFGTALFAAAWHYSTKRHDANYLRQEEIFKPREGETLLQHIKRIITDRLIGYYMYSEKKSEGFIAEPEYDENGRIIKIKIKKEKADYYGLGGWLHANGDKVKYALFIMGLCTCTDKVSKVALKHWGIDLPQICPKVFKAVAKEAKEASESGTAPVASQLQNLSVEDVEFLHLMRKSVTENLPNVARQMASRKA